MHFKFQKSLSSDEGLGKDEVTEKEMTIKIGIKNESESKYIKFINLQFIFFITLLGI
jgi:hypothetical protein